MRISECREEDVVLLDEYMPSPGSTSLHGPRFARHSEGASTFLIAWRGQLPVGSCEVLWEGCEAPEVRAVHEDCPEIQGLGNWPGTLRAQSVGTALIRTAEARVRERKCFCVGLGVEKNNPRTADLYKRLGYTPSTPYLDCGVYLDGTGVFHRVADACTFMIKYL
ncbi:GNAT family N-acetyltransferase [Streptomyces ovatisporus]|uniref:GNAT family N-acetyltransferase n=1 Tax=Streptomyces ovatisporus TaxID=1128682 RepID=A0ABV9A8V9_9ACTN